MTSKTIKGSLEKQFGHLTNTPRQIEGWVSKANLWGERRNFWQQGQQISGRILWTLRDEYLDKNECYTARTKLHSTPSDTAYDNDWLRKEDKRKGNFRQTVWTCGGNGDSIEGTL
ncbi:unnamed protein product [Absidia cylindrospora]